jgi:hypothetical protein
MSDVEGFDPEDYEGVEEKVATLPRREVRRLERDRRELHSTRSELEAARRELAFAKAGIDVDDPAFKYFVKAYEGDLDRDAIRAEAVAARLIGPPPADADEMAGHEMLGRASAGGREPSQENEITRQLADAGKIHWRNEEQARDEIMRIVRENDIKLHVTG